MQRTAVIVLDTERRRPDVRFSTFNLSSMRCRIESVLLFVALCLFWGVLLYGVLTGHL